MLIWRQKMAVLAIFGLAAAACSGSEFTPGKSESDGGGSGGSSGSAGAGGSTCASCAPKVKDWNGPVAVLTSPDDSAKCAGDYPNEVFVGKSGLVKEPADCHCECTVGSVVCTNPGVYFYKEGTCTTACGEVETIPTGTCQSLSPVAAKCSDLAQGWEISATVTGSCVSKQVSNTPAPKWAETVRGCESASTEPCENQGSCLPKLPSTTSKLCIWKDGPVACPQEYSDDSFRVYKNVDDTRGCTGTCGCGKGYCGKVALFSDTGCSAPAGPEFTIPGACRHTPESAVAGTFNPEVGCPPTGNFAAAGEIVEKGAISICCRL